MGSASLRVLLPLRRPAVLVLFCSYLGWALALAAILMMSGTSTTPVIPSSSAAATAAFATSSRRTGGTSRGLRTGPRSGTLLRDWATLLLVSPRQGDPRSQMGRGMEPAEPRRLVPEMTEGLKITPLGPKRLCTSASALRLPFQ